MIDIPARRYSSTSASRSAERGDCRIGAALVGAQRRHGGADLVEAGPPDALGVGERPLGVVEIAAQDVAGTGDVEEHRRQGVSGEVVQLAGDAPTLLGDRLVGERPAGLLELDDQRLLPVHEATDGEREHVGDHPRLPADVLLGRPRTRRSPTASAAAKAVISAARAVDSSRADDVQDHRHAEEQHRFEDLLARRRRTKIGTTTRTANTSAGSRVSQPWRTNARTAGDTINRSSGVPGIRQLGDRRDHHGRADQEAVLVRGAGSARGPTSTSPVAALHAARLRRRHVAHAFGPRSETGTPPVGGEGRQAPRRRDGRRRGGR